MDKIDFVIIWVDGNDPEWQTEKIKYKLDKDSDSRVIRYRDWDNLRYLFRGIEKFTPWVNKVHFVTWGHLPKWLNINNPKLNIVKHSDYIPEEYLPTFSSHPIELNLHRIKELEEKFVYFNDDTFIIDYMKEIDFFRAELPCDVGVLNAITPVDETFFSILNNDISIINKNYKKKEVIKRHFTKWFNIKYGKDIIRTLLCLPWTRLIGFKDFHNPNAFLKSTFEEVWEKEYRILDETSKRKFRDKLDVNQYIFRYWQLVNGKFVPKSNRTRAYRVFEELEKVCNTIENQRCKMICINDSDSDRDFEKTKDEIIESFEKILPDKSSFEI